jgi:hypothetical protein
MVATFRFCTDCGSEHLGPACGMTFAQRLKTVRVDKANFDTAEKHNYFDREAANAVFGLSADERPEDIMAEETEGKGFLDRSEMRDAPTDELMHYLDGPEEDPNVVNAAV